MWETLTRGEILRDIIKCSGDCTQGSKYYSCISCPLENNSKNKPSMGNYTHYGCGLSNEEVNKLAKSLAVSEGVDILDLLL